MKLLIVGYGKMGTMIDDMAADHGFDVVGRVDVGRDEWRDADVAVDFTNASALEANFQKYVERRMPVVIGTTGWVEVLGRIKAAAESSGLGVGRRGREEDAGAPAVRCLDSRGASFGQA